MIGEARFGRLRAAFDEILEGDPARRDEAIRRWSGADLAFEAELRALLAADERSTTPLDTPPLRALREGKGPPPEEGTPEEGAPKADAPEPIPGFRLLDPIGRGGSSTVYLAEQQGEGFTRPVALKILGRWVDASLLRRFRAEQRILAALEHPGIARLYDAGIGPSGRPYLAMELVRGTTLIEHCKRIEASLSDRIALFLAVLAAVEHAHASSIVHRDLKPGNILVSERGEPKLLDFGIARLLESESGEAPDATQTQHRAMTPAYASPEQVRGEPVDRASDIYSLGVVLYELLTGRRPYKVGDTSLEALERAIRDQDPEPPGLGGDLDAILAKALRKEPAERYASAADFAADLERYRDGRSVLARRGSLIYRLGKEVRRRRGLWLNAALGTALIAGIAVWLSGGLGGPASGAVDPNASPWLGMPVAAAAKPSYTQGLDALARSETTKAIANLRAAAAEDPDQPLIHAALATAHARASHDLLARAEGQQALQLATHAPRESRLLIEAVALQTSGRKAEEAKLRRALWLLAPGNFEVGLLLARSLAESGTPEEALEVAAKLRALPAQAKPAWADLRIGLVEGDALNMLGRPLDGVRISRATAAGAKAKGLPVVAAQALLAESQAQDGMGQADLSQALAEEARRLFEPRGESGGVVRALNLECIGAVRRAAHEEAERLCGECARRAERVGSASGVARALANVGMSRRRQGLVLSARTAFVRAIAIESNSVLGDRVNQARYLHNLANLDTDLGRLAEAEDGYRSAIIVLREAGNQASLLRSLGSLAVVLMYRGALAEAETVLAEAEPLARKAGSPRDLANTLWQRGDLAKLEGKIDDARRWYDQAAVPLASVSGDLVPRFQASRKQLAEPSERACRDLESSQQELGRLGDRTAVEIAVGISRCWSEAGLPAQAKRWLDRSEKEATASQLPSIRVEFELARAAVALGAHRWSEADKVLQGAAAECRRVSLGYHLMETRLLEARLALARGDHPERVRTLAEELERDALAGRFGKIAREAGEILRAPRLARG